MTSNLDALLCVLVAIVLATFVGLSFGFFFVDLFSYAVLRIP